MFGDAELRVPSEWKIRFETISIVGDIIDRRPRHAERRDADGDPDLIVSGVDFLGDIKIRD
jgi:hypothetical protein